MIAAFEKFVRIVPPCGALVACFDDPLVRRVAEQGSCRVISYGQDNGFDWSLSGLEVTPDGTFFTVHRNGELLGRFRSVLPGRHNALNAMAVMAVLDRIGVNREEMEKGLAGFKGVRRRQEVRGVVGGVTVIDDFAHHPTAVRETLGALRAAYSGRRLIAVFEPRTNSSRRSVFQKAYVGSFDSADYVLIREPVPLDNLAPEQCFNSQRLAADLAARGIAAHYFPSTDAILADLANVAQPGDVIAILSNGGFDNIHVRLLDQLQHGSADST